METEKQFITITDNEHPLVLTPKIDNPILSFRVKNEEVLTFKADGKILVRDKLVEEDKSLVDALRQFLKDSGYNC